MPDLTLLKLIETTTTHEELHHAYQQSRYYQEDSWQMLETLWDDLNVVFSFLQSRDFEGYWQREILPQITPAQQSLQSILPAYDILPQVEQQLGFRLASSEITTYLIHFTRPHGISLTGTRFISSPAWPVEVIIRTSIHEMMHPPFDIHNPQLHQLIQLLRQDPFLMERFTGHNPSFGYNTLEGLIDEDCVQALDQVIGEHFGVARDPRERWKGADEGLHVFAVALYALMRNTGYSPQNQRGTFQDFLIDALQTSLRPGQIGPLYADFYQQRP